MNPKKTKTSIRMKMIRTEMNVMSDDAVRSSEDHELWMVGETAHEYKVHVHVDAWDGGKCL